MYNIAWGKAECSIYNLKFEQIRIFKINKIIETKQIYYKNERGDTNVQQSLWCVEFFLQGVLKFHLRYVR